MNILATIVIAPVLAWFVSNRKVVYGVLAAVFFLALAPTAHAVLLDEQLDKRSMSNTLGFFFVNYVGLGIAIGIAALVLRKRHRPTAASAAIAP